MSINNPFLKATPLYKEYAILELLSKNSNITQRAIAKELDSSLSMINQYLEEYEKKELIQREHLNGKNTKYILTEFGEIRLNFLNIQFLESIRETYLLAKDKIIKFLNEIHDMGYKKIVMYGAGEVAEITLQVFVEEAPLPLEVVSVIDDSPNKQGTSILGIDIISKEVLKEIDFDCILISSYTHRDVIKDKLLGLGINENIIFDYFSLKKV